MKVAFGIVMSPSDKLFLFGEGQRQENAVVANGPDDLEGSLRPCPFSYLVAIEKMT